MIRVVHLTNVVAPDKLGGLERYVRELAEELARQGASVTVVAKTGAGGKSGVEVVNDRLTLVRYRPPSKRNPFFGLLYPLAVSGAVRIALRRAGATRRTVAAGEVTIHGHFPLPMIPVLIGRLPFLYTMHAPVHKELLGERQASYALPRPVQRLAVGVLARLERNIIRRSGAVITLSDFIAGEVERLNDGPIRTVRIPGGIDLGRFNPGPGKQHRGKPVLFTARRLVERTGVELLIAAMPRVLESLPGARLYVAGDGPRRDAVIRLIERLGLEDNVELLGRITDNDLVSWFRSADICVTPTLYLEGFGLSTAEAAACGALPVVTPAGANPELVRGVHPALLAATTTSSALADSIVTSFPLIHDSGVMRRAQDVVVPSMGWEVVAARHLDLYGEHRRSLSELRGTASD